VRPADRVGAASVVLAATALLWNDLPSVREHLSRVIATASSRHDPPTATAIALLRARLAGARPDGRRALDAATAARGGQAPWRVYPDVLDMVELATMGAHLMLGDTAAARGCLEGVSDSPERALALGHLHLAEGDIAKARSVLTAAARRAVRPTTMVVAALSLGRLAFLEGDANGAVQALRQALELARPEQLRRPFAEAGAWVRQVLREHPELAAQHAWIAPRPTAAPPDGELAPVVESLTEREIEVLDRLAQALSTEDIANALYVSVNTVKTHLKSIYRKLGTSGRSAAARRARELNLLRATERDR
jgi:LuxR family maltose regulon positive regulatory protein